MASDDTGFAGQCVKRRSIAGKQKHDMDCRWKWKTNYQYVQVGKIQLRYPIYDREAFGNLTHRWLCSRLFTI